MFSEYKKHFLRKYSNFHAKFTFKMCLNLIACLEIILMYLKLKKESFLFRVQPKFFALAFLTLEVAQDVA